MKGMSGYGAKDAPNPTYGIYVRGSTMQIESLARTRVVSLLEENTRKIRLNLLLMSSTAIVIAHTGLVPKQIQGFGIEFSEGQQSSMLACLLVLVTFLLFSFVISASADFVSARLLRKEAVKSAFKRVIDDGITNYTGNPIIDQANIDIKKSMEIILQPLDAGKGVIDWLYRIRLWWEFVLPVCVSTYALIVLGLFWYRHFIH